jgi:hypothetical protein
MTFGAQPLTRTILIFLLLIMIVLLLPLTYGSWIVSSPEWPGGSRLAVTGSATLDIVAATSVWLVTSIVSGRALLLSLSRRPPADGSSPLLAFSLAVILAVLSIALILHWVWRLIGSMLRVIG